MKRIISCLLAVVLALAPCLQVSASGTDLQVSPNAWVSDETDTGMDDTGPAAGSKGDALEQGQEDPSAGVDGTDVPEQNLTDEDSEADVSEQEDPSGSAGRDDTGQQEDDNATEGRVMEAEKEDLGQIDVTIISAVALKSPVEFTASVTGADMPEQAQTIHLKESTELEHTQANTVIKGLKPQKYTLTVTAPGFAVYTQDIQVEDSLAYKVQLMTGIVKGYEEIDNHPGVLIIGDVDGDGKITDDDKDKLVTVIDGGSVEGCTTDLNGDGKTDLADLEYFAKGYKFGPDIISSVEKYVPADTVTVSENNVKVQEGNIQDLFTSQGGKVSLSPANEQPISSENPVEMEFYLDETKNLPVDAISIEMDQENPITEASFTIVYEDGSGQEQSVTVPYSEAEAAAGIYYMMRDAAAQSLGVNVSRDPASGSIVLDLGAQVPVKKVTFKITGVKNNNNLAEISKVEFIGDMASRIPAPQMDIPENVSVENESQAFTVKWDPCVNVTGYEVWVEEKKDDGTSGKSCVKPVTGNTIKISSIGEGKDGKIINGRQYIVKVQSVNGTWRSGYSKECIAEPRSVKVPDAPDNLSLTGKYKAIAASWKDMDDTETYNLYYKKVDGETQYTKIEGIKTNSHTISNLEDRVKYEVYVTGVNTVGEGSPSLKRQVQTEDMDPAHMPAYKRINEAGEGEISEHIKKATVIGGGEMKESPQDKENGTIWGTVDNDHGSYYRITSWDLGGFNDNNNGLYYEFDKAYKLQNIGLQSSEAEYTDFSYTKIYYWDENGEKKSVPYSFQRKQDEKGKYYYWFRLSEAVTATKIKIGLGRYLATAAYSLITVSEVNFYHYDSLEDDINALYQDDLHTVLKEDVTQTTIDGLRARINTPDEVTGEYHPDKDLLEKELQTAEDILNAKELSSPVRIHRSITTKDTGRGFSGLNGWQPLGITAAAGDKLIVYVGHKTMKTGDATGMAVVATQYHSESNGVVSYTSTQLSIGRNEIVLPKPKSPIAGCESGGALYVQYSGNKANDDYAVRIDGGTEVPILDLYNVADQAERQKRTEDYVAQLTSYVSEMEQKHKERHEGSENELVDMPYDVQNCILGASDIMLDKMMLSLPAQQIFAGAGNGTAEQKAQTILNSMDAMEEMMDLFYQHKGLNKNAKNAIDQIPLTHLNIRYQRMFAGAFMYAGGNHIGIEYGSAPGMVSGVPVQKDENGKWISGRYFGWGIAHEIGHNINQGAYAVAEITNNYFSVLAQAKDTNDSVRFKYANVYDKVTSGTKGNAPNVFTQLGMYWQLHLAYDNGYNYKTYDDHAEQLSNLFFARVDSYARTPANAPKPGGVALTLSGDSDQKLMRLACAAAEKDILDFFERWGKTPDGDTIKYASQFEKETRAIYYVNDEARVYRVEGEGSSLAADGTTEAVGDGTTAKINASAKNQVDLTFDYKTIPEEDLLGYEIVRCIRSNGQVEEQIAGFAHKDNKFTFSDHITTMNNRVVTYKVTVIDKYLNRSAPKMLEPLKIEHEGNIDKTNWTVDFNNITSVEDKKVVSADEYIPCGPEEEDPIKKVIDGDSDTTYVGRIGNNAEVILRFNRRQTVTALQYTVKTGTQIKDYSISVLEENGGWKEVKAGTFEEKDVQNVYFANPNQISGNIGAYSTEAVKLVIKDASGTEVSISELDVLGVTGDNVDFRSDDTGQPAIGKLAAAYKYEGREIPADSIVFIGSYKGNSAYNVVILYDQDGNIVGGTRKEESGEESLNAQQLVFSTVPEEGEIQDVYDGTWVYWIEPQDNVDLSSLKQVRAELYRVDDAETNEGQRMVSDSLFKTMPDTLPDVTINGNQ